MHIELGSDDCFNCEAYQNLAGMEAIEMQAAERQVVFRSEGIACTMSEGSFVCTAAQRAVCSATMRYPRLELGALEG